VFYRLSLNWNKFVFFEHDLNFEFRKFTQPNHASVVTPRALMSRCKDEIKTGMNQE
jgi:hypothetical protein